ncbi:B12-binding domain-containing radical SAM protein, partial [Nanoarchaeota archaeon]
MKILMLNPPWVKDFCRSARWAAVSRGRVQRHPDWMLIATAVLEKEGHTVKFIDGPTCNLCKDDIVNIMKKFKPEMVVIHTTTPSIYNDIGYAKLAKLILGSNNKGSDKRGSKKKKNLDVITVLIGPHVTAEPKNTFDIAKGSVDYIALGEYDYTLRDIANGLVRKKLKGVAYMSGQKLISKGLNPVPDVNELPFPAWHQINPKWYWDAGKLYPFLTLISGRGCIGRCTFCRDAQLMCVKPVRLRDPKLIVDEMEYGKRLFPKIREIMFETDTFTVSPPHVRELCSEIIKRKLNKKLRWSCNVRVDMDLKLLPLMKKAGCRMLMIGFEFGTQKALDAVKKDIKISDSIRFAKAASKLGFILHGCFMIGAPGETRESALQTIKFAKSLPLDTIQISGICVYPGTELYKWAKSEGYLVAKDWTDFVSKDYEQVTLLSYPQLSKKEIDELIDKGLREFYLRPKQIIKMILNIRSFGDIKRKLFGLKSF